VAVNNWIKFPTFYQSMDQISLRHAKKLGPAPLNLKIWECNRWDISQFEVCFAI